MSSCIGIDIGMGGAIARIHESGATSIHDMPTVGVGPDRRIDGRGLILLLRQLVVPGVPTLIVIEDIRVRKIAGRVMNHSTETLLVEGKGVVRAVADIMGATTVQVQPATWKRFFGLIRKNKNAGREVAMRLYPSAAPDIKRVRDHNRGDAILLAHFGLVRLA